MQANQQNNKKPHEENPLSECQKKCEEYLNCWKRERADFLNYKKDETERMQNLIEYANEELCLKIIPILDSIDIARKNAPEDLKDNRWLEGILQIENQLLALLKKEDILPIKALGEKFNPAFMEAVGEAEAQDCEPQTVVEEIQKGYTTHGKLLRAAKVKISK